MAPIDGPTVELFEAAPIDHDLREADIALAHDPYQRALEHAAIGELPSSQHGFWYTVASSGAQLDAGAGDFERFDDFVNSAVQYKHLLHSRQQRIPQLLQIHRHL